MGSDPRMLARLWGVIPITYWEPGKRRFLVSHAVHTPEFPRGEVRGEVPDHRSVCIIADWMMLILGDVTH